MNLFEYLIFSSSAAPFAFTLLLLYPITPRVSPVIHIGQSSLILFGPIQKVKFYSHYPFLQVSCHTSRPAIIAHMFPTMLLYPLRSRLYFCLPWQVCQSLDQQYTGLPRSRDSNFFLADGFLPDMSNGLRSYDCGFALSNA